jgi:hypothetical protein
MAPTTSDDRDGCDAGDDKLTTNSSGQNYGKLQQWWLLTLLTASYVVGELSHFLIGVTSRDVARTIHYGDVACFENATSSDSASADREDIPCSSRRNISRFNHATSL